MKLDMQLMFLMAAIGLGTKRMDLRSWFFLCTFIAVFLAYNWLRA